MAKIWTDLSSRITTVIKKPLVDLFLKMHLFRLKRAASLSLLLAFKLSRQIRLAIPEARLEGHDEGIDDLVHLVKLRLTHPEIFDGENYRFLRERTPDQLKNSYQALRERYESKKEKIDAILDRVREDPAVTDTIRNYWLLQHYMETLTLNPEPQVLGHYLATAKTLFPEARQLSPKDLTRLRKRTKKDLAELKERISDRDAIKLSWSINDITPLLGVISPFFLFTGYLYNHYLLGEFGIEVSKYFRLTDYISSSIEGIRYSFVGAAGGVLGVFLGVHNWSRQSAIERDYERNQKDYWYYGLFIVLPVGMVIGYLKNLETFYTATSITIVLLGAKFSPVIARKYFSEPKTIYWILFFITCFGAYMFLSIGTETYRYKNYDFSKLTTYDVKFTDSSPTKDAQLVLLAGNSDYFFFLDRQRKPLIVPRTQVLQLRPNLP